MSELSTKLFGANLCGEALAVEALEKRLAALELLIGLPACPYCKKAMVESRHIGYYDRFDYWGCGCSELPKADKNSWNGQYVGV